MWELRRLCRGIWIFTSFLVIIAVPWMAFVMRQQQYSVHAISWFTAGVFVMMALPITVFEVVQHLDSYTKPQEQKRIIRILVMVPVYAVDSWLALRFKDMAIYINTLRECYEAYVIYSFFEYLLAYVGGEAYLGRRIEEKVQVYHVAPFSWFLSTWHMGPSFVRRCKYGVHNYVLLRPLTTIAALFCEWGGIYAEGKYTVDRAYLYLSMVDNVSQIWAVYCLILFYRAAHQELEPMKPFAKFLCIKAVIFFSFWQSVAITVLVRVGIIRRTGSSDYNVDDVATGIQDFLICIEMFFAAIAHGYAFSAREYMDPGLEKRPLWQSIIDMCDITDVTKDTWGRVASARDKVLGSMTAILPLSNSPKGQRVRLELPDLAAKDVDGSLLAVENNDRQR